VIYATRPTGLALAAKEAKNVQPQLVGKENLLLGLIN